MYENKIAIIVRNDLKTWQKLNVTAFLAGSVAIKLPETHGDDLVTASGNHYLPFTRQPILIYQAENAEQIKRAFHRAKDRELHIGIYTEPLFSTMTERDNLSEIARHKDEDLDLVGIVFYGDQKKVNKAVDGLKFHS